ncbi:Lactate utilization protein C [Corynebacterium massiliense DSM 45435]|uniref:Lactate utilization protein C n=2 Tax=Corynebacterium massiliense TaxID=441501 RepID=A0ABY7U6J2_9CORY|nr:Lactate utilization protein C [Corynebacterium massiliense DSM 45435]
MSAHTASRSTSRGGARTAADSRAAKKEILQRIKRAQKMAKLPKDVEIPRDYQQTSSLPADEVRDVLVDRLEDYHAEVHVTDADGLAQTVADVLKDRECTDIVHAPGLGEDVLTSFAGSARADDPASDPRDLGDIDAVVTESKVSCALTGTIALESSESNGRRAVALVPDRHVCIVRDEDIVYTVPEMISRLDPERPTTLFSGPSATSDIELERVEGVHGPRDLIVVIVKQG